MRLSGPQLERPMPVIVFFSSHPLGCIFPVFSPLLILHPSATCSVAEKTDLNGQYMPGSPHACGFWLNSAKALEEIRR